MLNLSLYGTDRQPLTSPDERWQQYQSALRATLIAGGIALLTGVLCYFTKRKTIGLVSIIALALTWWFGRATLLEKQRVAADNLESNRRYGSVLHETALGVRTERGICLVSVPKTHQRGSGELEVPGLTEFKVDRARHFEILRKLSLGHSYFMHPAILQDLRYLFGDPRPGSVREWLQEHPIPSTGSYWTFRPELLKTP